jgi:hypothetical protein
VASAWQVLHALHAVPLPWYPALHAQITPSALDPAGHDPDFSALVSHVLQAVHVTPSP